MALVARMVASEVTGRSGTPWVPAEPEDEDAVPVQEAFGNYHYGVPVWLRGTTLVKPKMGQGSESFKLTVVRSKDGDDPSNEWFTASPSGELTMLMENPEGFGYIVPGAEYRVTIERIRGPRSTKTAGFTVDPAEVVGAFGVHDGSGNRVGG